MRASALISDLAKTKTKCDNRKLNISDKIKDLKTMIEEHDCPDLYKYTRIEREGERKKLVDEVRSDLATDDGDGRKSVPESGQSALFAVIS